MVRKDGGGGESFFLLWGEVQLLFCLAFVLFQKKKKKKSYLLAHMRFKPTASEQLHALLAFKPQEPDVLCL